MSTEKDNVRESLNQIGEGFKGLGREIGEGAKEFKEKYLNDEKKAEYKAEAKEALADAKDGISAFGKELKNLFNNK